MKIYQEPTDLPADLDSERFILGWLMLMGDQPVMAAETLPQLSPEDFYNQTHQKVWSVMRDLFADKVQIDLLTVVERARIKYPGIDWAYISELIDGVPKYSESKFLRKYFQNVKECAARRHMLRLFSHMTAECMQLELAPEEIIEETVKSLNSLSLLQVGDNLISSSEAVSRTMVELEKRWDSGDSIIGLSTGIPELDRLIGGFCPGKTYVIAAGTGMGKTTLLLNMVNSAIAGARTKAEECAGLMVSLEMTCPELIVKLIGIETRINTRKIKSGFLVPEEKREIMMAADSIAKHHLEFVEGFGRITPTTLSAMVERVRSKWGRIDFLAVDYIQLLDAAEKSKGGEYERITEVSRELKRLAIQYSMPVLILSQLNRKSSDRTNRDYTKSDLRGSGQIEQDADVILFLMPENWDDPEDKRRRLKIDKNRDGAPDEIVNLIFFPEHSRFVPAAHESQY